MKGIKDSRSKVPITLKWLFVGLVLLLIIPMNAAAYDYSTDGYGTFSVSKSDITTGHGLELNYHYVNDSQHLYAYVCWAGTINNNKLLAQGIWSHDICDGFFYYSGWQSSPVKICVSTDCNGVTDTTIRGQLYVNGGTSSGTIVMIVSNSPFINYIISGNLNCVDWVELYIKNNDGSYSNIDKNTSSYYGFSIINGQDYKLVFSNGYEHEFICDGNINYDYDDCSYTTININDECANLLYNQFTWIDDGGTIVYEGRDNPIILSSAKVNKDDKLIVMWNTWLGALQKTCYAQFDHDINLYDPFIYWDMEIYIYDNESNPIDHANVDFNQDCVINGYPTRNKFTDNSGMASFIQCENKGANLVVSRDGYKTLSTSVSGGWYDVYTSTYQVSVTLQSLGSDNSSTWNLINNSINDANATENATDIPDADGVPYDINIYFRNTNGDYVNQINDTDDYVRCYYSVNTPDDVDMTLVFQKSFTGYYFYDIDTYSHSIDNNSYGYFNISNSYFNDSTYSYRAYIYDVSYPSDDRYAYLNVVNQTEPYYNNLTGYCMFMNTNKNGSIDYREDITCYAMIISDNTSLRTVSLELYDNSTLIDYTNLTNSSFDDDIYGWYLGHNYTLGHNYSLVLKGYDGSILDVDNVIAYNLVGNKLTIKVTDSFNHPLSNVYVFCEHYGSINTGYLSYGTFEGLPNGESRYKASKSGYRSGTWKTVNLTSENEVVTYQLTQEQIESSVSAVRMSDNSVKDLYYPFMYFLLIIILIGGLLHVVK